jgi:hypothetical protein
VRQLSSIIDELAITTMDPLKIDVEGAEEEVLEGIEERHWPVIRQAVVEVHRGMESRKTPWSRDCKATASGPRQNS